MIPSKKSWGPAAIKLGRGKARQDTITAIFRMIDEGRLTAKMLDDSVLIEIVDLLTSQYAEYGIRREDHRRMVSEVWDKVKTWLDGED